MTRKSLKKRIILEKYMKINKNFTVRSISANLTDNPKSPEIIFIDFDNNHNNELIRECALSEEETIRSLGKEVRTKVAYQGDPSYYKGETEIYPIN